MFKMSLCFTISWPGGHFCKNSKAVEKGNELWPKKKQLQMQRQNIVFLKGYDNLGNVMCGGINAVCRASYRRKREEWQIKFCVLLWCSVIRCDVAL